MVVILVFCTFIFTSCKKDNSIRQTLYNSGAFYTHSGIAWKTNIKDVIKKLPDKKTLKESNPERYQVMENGFTTVKPKQEVNFKGIDEPFSVSYNFTDKGELYGVCYGLYNIKDKDAYTSAVTEISTQIFEIINESSKGDKAVIATLKTTDIDKEPIQIIWNGKDDTIAILSSTKVEDNYSVQLTIGVKSVHEELFNIKKEPEKK